MKLYYKLALLNSFTRIVIVAGFLIFLPDYIYNVSISHIDARLERKETKVLHIIKKKGMGEFMTAATDSTEGDSTWSDYTLFKENFVSIEPATQELADTII